MTSVTQPSFLLAQPQITSEAAGHGDLNASNVPAVASPAMQWIANAAPVATSVTAVAGLTAMAMWSSSELTLAGAAVLAAGAAGVAAARLFTARTTTTASLAAFAGIAGLAALTTVGAMSSVHSGKAELDQARTVLKTEMVAVTAERGALARERAAVDTQRLQVASQLSAVQIELSGLTSGRRTLNEERDAFDLRVREAAERLIAPEKERLATATTALDTERNGVVDARRASVAEEAKRLTSAQLRAIESAVVYHNERSSSYIATKIAGDIHPGTGPVGANHRSIPPDRVVSTLVSKGYVIVGPSTVRDDYPVILAQGATKITSVAQLIEYLRLATRADLPGPP